MGIGGISIWQILIVLAIILLLLGPKRLKAYGSELGNALKGFRKAIDDKEEQMAILSTFVRLGILIWAGGILTLNYVTINVISF